MPGDGPIPKRPSERRRRNKESIPQVVEIPRAPDAELAPPADDSWHPRAKALYDSLMMSGQAVFYEPSDREMAGVACELLSRQLNGDKLNANAIAVVMNMMSCLLATEGDRRRARLILEHSDAAEEPPAVALMAKYRKAAKR